MKILKWIQEEIGERRWRIYEVKVIKLRIEERIKKAKKVEELSRYWRKAKNIKRKIFVKRRKCQMIKIFAWNYSKTD